MELRVHGIGGTSVASMLGEAHDSALVPRWPLADGTVPHVWHGRRRDVLAFHWAKLTSGSRWFVLWPLALPFTLLNAAGFMHPRGRLGDGLRALHTIVCLSATAWFSALVVFGGQEVAAARRWNDVVGLAISAAVIMAVITPSAFHCSWRAGEAPQVSRPGSPLEDPAFFRTGRRLWALHVVVVLAVAGAVACRAELEHGVRTIGLAAERSVVDIGAVVVLLLAVMVVLTVVSSLAAPGQRPWQWGLAAVGAGGLGMALIGGLVIALLRVVVGEPLDGPAYVLFDIYGIAIIAAIAVAGTGAVVELSRKSPGERLVLDRPPPGKQIEIARLVLPDPSAAFRARLALLPRAAVVAVGAAVLTFICVGAVVFIDRAQATVARWADWLRLPSGVRDLLPLPADATGAELVESAWQAGSSPPARVAQFVIWGLFVVMFINLVKSFGAADQLRRVGSVWDVLTFWPRRFHPFAVRPYSECAVDQLRELLFAQVDEDWPDELDVLGHSQGSMLVIAALAPARAPGGTEPTTSRVHQLVTVGSPLRSLYMNAFPAYVSDSLVRAVLAAMPAGAKWSNVFRFTDHVGRTAFADEASWRPTHELPPEAPHRRWWRAAEYDQLTDSVIADPPARGLPVSGHNHYWDDPRVREVLGDVREE